MCTVWYFKTASVLDVKEQGKLNRASCQRERGGERMRAVCSCSQEGVYSTGNTQGPSCTLHFSSLQGQVH